MYLSNNATEDFTVFYNFAFDYFYYYFISSTNYLTVF